MLYYAEVFLLISVGENLLFYKWRIKYNFVSVGVQSPTEINHRQDKS